jgi:hypothetical protein
MLHVYIFILFVIFTFGTFLNVQEGSQIALVGFLLMLPVFARALGVL